MPEAVQPMDFSITWTRKFSLLLKLVIVVCVWFFLFVVVVVYLQI